MITVTMWIVTIFLFLAVLGGIYKLSSEGFKWNEFVGLLIIMFVVVVFATILFTGSFTL
jgi:hypothetical protein